MNRILLCVLAVLLALALGLGWWGKHQYDTASRLRIENSALVEAADRAVKAAKRDRQVLVARQAEIAVQARKLALAQASLAEALKSNRAWADQPVPTDIQKALQNGD